MVKTAAVFLLSVVMLLVTSAYESGVLLLGFLAMPLRVSHWDWSI